jgi:streptomycin 6-kinase
VRKRFEEHASSYGPEGTAWLNRIPQIIETASKRWNLTINPPFELSYNYVAPATRLDGQRVVLKIGFPKDPEFKTEIAALKVFNGDGIEKLLEEDLENSAILIERVMPGVPLSAMEDDEEATRILARVMKQLWKPLPANRQFPTIDDWAEGLINYKNKYEPGMRNIPYPLVAKANELFSELIATSGPAQLLHGDLHHDNVLRSGQDGWTIIDPKGVAAEPAYETAAMMRNPHKVIVKRQDLGALLEKRAEILAEELGFDKQRILKWAFAQTVLSAVWHETEGKSGSDEIKIAEILEKLLTK